MSDTNTPEEDFPSQIPTNVTVRDVATAPATQQPRRQRSTEERTGYFQSTPEQQNALSELYSVAEQAPPRPVNQMSRTQASREMQRLFRNPKVREQWAEQPVQPRQIARLNDLYGQLVEAGVANKANTSQPASKLEAADRIDEFQQMLAASQTTGPFSL